jgi:hypothetical protein
VTKIVCRLLTAENQLLGWCEHVARMRGDGTLRSDDVVQIAVSTSGAPACVSLHWCDANTEIRHGWTGIARVEPGMVVTLFPRDAPMVVIGPMPTNLPPVTVGSTAIGIPVGEMGAKSSV